MITPQLVHDFRVFCMFLFATGLFLGMLAGVLAFFFPARRATRVDPMIV